LTDSSTDHDIFGIAIRFNPKPDGNCQFASLCEQLKYKLNIDISHAHLRRAVVEHLRNDDTANLTQHFVSEPWSSYLRKMDLLGTYGDHITLMTVAVLYKVQIIVLSTTKIATLISSKGNAAFDPAISSLFVGHFPEGHGEHYVSLEHPTDPLTFVQNVSGSVGCSTSKLTATHVPAPLSMDNAPDTSVNSTENGSNKSDTQVPGDVCDIRKGSEWPIWPSVWSIEQWQEKQLAYPWLFCKKWSYRL